MRLESIIVLSADPETLTYDGQCDNFVGIEFTYGS